MSFLASSLAGSAMVVLVAAPGEPPVAERDIPEVAKAAVGRRLDKDVLPSFRRIVVKHSDRMPGYVVCGEVAGAIQRGPCGAAFGMGAGGVAVGQPAQRRLDFRKHRSGSGVVEKGSYHRVKRRSAAAVVRLLNEL